MEYCNECGGEIVIRNMGGGHRQKFHVGGIRCSHKYSTKPYREPLIYEKTCFPTKCEYCGEEIYFIRHNGGSVWLDPPLGWPWPKHRCYYRVKYPEWATFFKKTLRSKKYANLKHAFGIIVKARFVVSDKTHPSRLLIAVNAGLDGMHYLAVDVQNSADYVLNEFVYMPLKCNWVLITKKIGPKPVFTNIVVTDEDFE